MVHLQPAEQMSHAMWEILEKIKESLVSSGFHLFNFFKNDPAQGGCNNVKPGIAKEIPSTRLRAGP